MLLERGMSVSHGRMTGVAGFSGKTQIRYMQIAQLLQFAAGMKLCLAGVQRQQQKYGQCSCNKQ
jgi:hypothetical protein